MADQMMSFCILKSLDDGALRALRQYYEAPLHCRISVLTPLVIHYPDGSRPELQNAAKELTVGTLLSMLGSRKNFLEGGFSVPECSWLKPVFNFKDGVNGDGIEDI